MTVSKVVAVAGPMTGPAAMLGREMAQAARLAFDDTADDDTVFEVHDDRGEVSAGVDLARSLARRPEVVGIIGHYNSNITFKFGFRFEIEVLEEIRCWNNSMRILARDA